MSENQLRLKNHVLVCVGVEIDGKDASEYEYLVSNFSGRVICPREQDMDTLKLTTQTSHGIVYVCGNVQLLDMKIENIASVVKVIKEFSHHIEGRDDLDFVTLGEVPINLHNAAVYYRSYLSSDPDNNNYFDLLQAKHKFQALTESNKPGTSFRKGIYLSEVVTDGDASNFHLLRCSTNFHGPTLAFIDEDREILAKVNELARQNFSQKTELNHVLAQVYENTISFNDINKIKEHKAKIPSHSDKTKDMPANGPIAFCTFYSSDIDKYKAPSHDRFDRYYKDASVLTQLRFRLKSEVHSQSPHLVKDFRVPLYPNSVLLIPLSTNRLYTHEIVPPSLPVGRFPTRLGYVVRCSETKAVYRDGTTFIQQDGKEDVKLERPTDAEFDQLKKLYQKENATAEMVEYGDMFFSLNEGDYKRPLVE